MPERLNFLRILILPVLFYSCTGDHLITDKAYLASVEKKFLERETLASHRKKELFSVFNKKLSLKQAEALEFLYAYMPLSDLADYSGEYFLANADIAIKAIENVPWGKNIPEDIFLHYVLPCRVNNENLDSFRIVCYDEIHQRIKGRSMKDAALEINYWCLEKVNYQPADIRTSSPLKTMLSARGRCGEESTLTVAALRTAGIPARQVYTPRWAHVDDNHAWVEIWIDGEWHYIGACEPEAVLDRGWFTEQARRAMLINTKSFGAAYGNENAINKFPDYTEINNLSTYAATKRIFVKVLNNSGSPVSGALVDYCLYNYAEFYPLTTVYSNDEGISSFETGLGDLLIWAGKDEEYAWEKIRVKEKDTLFLTLKPGMPEDTGVDLDLDVPPVLSPSQGPSEEIIRRNSERVSLANSVRLNYIDSWIKTDEVNSIALKKDIDTRKAFEIFSRAMGNYEEIRKFLLSTPDSLIQYAVMMLEVLPDKDLRDTRAEILGDHLFTSLRNQSSPQVNDFFIRYVVNPRVSNEMLVAWRSYLFKALPAYVREDAKVNPLIIRDFINDSILIKDDENYYKTPLTPIGIYELRVSDEDSRAILFVAICRSLGIPSRLGPGQNIPQFYDKGQWNDVFFNDQEPNRTGTGFLKIITKDRYPVPEYSIHFTIAKLKRGRYSTLDYEFGRKASDFTDELELPAGKYMIVTGNRLVNGKILAHISFFELRENEHRSVEINLRKDNTALMPSGKIDFSGINGLFPGKSLDISKGAMLFWIEQGKEPTRHIFADLPAVKKELDNWGGPLIFLETSTSQALTESFNDLPANSFFGQDHEMKAFSSCVKFNKSQTISLPLIMFMNPEGYILFTSSGYTIGIGDQLIKSIRQN